MKAAVLKWAGRLLLLAVVLIFLYPFFWMLMSSFEGSTKAVFDPLRFWPKEPNAQAHRSLGSLKPSLWMGLLNSVLIAGLQATLATGVAALAGFAFARKRFRAHGLLLFVALLPILVPRQLLAQPLAEWLLWLKLGNNLFGVILPGAVSGLGLLYFLHVFRQVPASLLDAAVTEGASEWRVFRTVLPLVGASLVTYGLIHFILAWHEHLVPLLVLHTPAKQTLPLMLSSLNDATNHVPKAVLFAASTWAVVPVVVLFALGYRHFRYAMSELTHTD